MTTAEEQRDLSLRFLRALWQPGEIRELRLLHVGPRQTPSAGYFDSPERLLQALAAIDQRGTIYGGGYYSVNPPLPACLARAANRVIDGLRTTTGDADIAKRTTLLIDLDPERPSGIMASAEERSAALARAVEVREFLRSLGFPAPLELDSGNGVHLLYRVDLPRDDAGVVRRILAALASKFDDGAVKVDSTVHNPARIARCPGSWNRKGDSTPDRPHRRATVLAVPESWDLVPTLLLEALAGPEPSTSRRHAARAGSGGPLDVPTFLARHGLAVSKEGSWSDGYRWELAACPFHPEHERTASVQQHSSGAVSGACLKANCEFRSWQALREHLEPGVYDRRDWGSHESSGSDAAEGTAHAGREPGEDDDQPAKKQPLIFTQCRPVGDLLDVVPAPQRWFLRHPTADGSLCAPGFGDGLMPRGIAGAISAGGGTGKTQLILQLAVSFLTGRLFLEHFTPVKPRGGERVLIVCAEETLEGIHRRLYHIVRGMDLDAAERAIVAKDLYIVPLGGSGPAPLLRCEGDTITPTAEFRALEQRLHGLAGADGWGLVVLDPLSRLAGIEAEADNMLATTLVQYTETLCRSPGEPVVLMVTHSSKAALREGKADSRGVSGLVDGFRFHVTLYGRGSSLVLEVQKNNYAKPSEPLNLTRGEHGILRAQSMAEAAASADDRESAKAAKEHRELLRRVEKVVEAVAQSRLPLTNLEDIAELAGIRKSSAGQAVKMALSDRRICHADSGTGRATYHLPPVPGCPMCGPVPPPHTPREPGNRVSTVPGPLGCQFPEPGGNQAGTREPVRQENRL